MNVETNVVCQTARTVFVARLLCFRCGILASLEQYSSLPAPGAHTIPNMSGCGLTHEDCFLQKESFSEKHPT
jgi:hypothetical protein